MAFNVLTYRDETTMKSINNLIYTALFALSVATFPSNSQAERVYVYKDSGSAENKGILGNVMPARAADTNSVQFKTSVKPDFNGKGTAVQVTFDLKQPPNWVGLVAPVQQDYWGEWDSSIEVSIVTREPMSDRMAAHRWSLYLGRLKLKKGIWR